jgi:hypothetical protein
MPFGKYDAAGNPIGYAQVAPPTAEAELWEFVAQMTIQDASVSESCSAQSARLERIFYTV